MNNIKKLIEERRSIRTFNNQEINKEDLDKIKNYILSVNNPFDVKVNFKLLNKKDNNVSSPVVTGTESYVAAKVKKVKNYEIAYGYSFEKFCLFATSLNIGTVMLAASLSRKIFENAMELETDEVMPVATPIGYKADKPSLLESIMLKGLKSKTRKDFSEIFFVNDFNTSLSKDNAGIFLEALEMMRLAPSSTNNQPWRAVKIGNTIHFYEYNGMKNNSLGDIKKLDVGISLCNFDLVLKDSHIDGSFVDKNPNIDLPEKIEYVISYEVKG